MAANVDIEKLFLRLFMFSHKISLPVVRTFFVSSVLGQSPYNKDIRTFFEHNKHELFHLIGDYKCCECTLLPPLNTSDCKIRLQKDQFKKLYDTGLSHPGHFMRGSGGRVFQQCICCISVKRDTDPKNYDITLLLTILHNCCQLSDNQKIWLDTIRKCRNRLCHLTDLNENEILSVWEELEYFTLQLAGEIPPKPNYKESIETQIEILKDADYSWNTVTPIMEAMKSEVNNNIKGVIQNQIIADEDLKCLKTNVEQLAQNFKKDNTNMFEHVSASAMAIMSTQHDELSRLSAQVDQYHITDVKHQKKVSGLLVHAMQKLNFIVDIDKEGGKPSQQNDKCSIQQTDITEKKRDAAKLDIEKALVELKISTPVGWDGKRETIKQYFGKSIEMLSLVAPFEVKYVRDGCILVGTLLPVAIIKNEEEFKRVISKFLDQMVTHCEIETSKQLVVKVKVTVFDNEQQGSVKCFIEEVKQIILIDTAVQAVPAMLDGSTEAREIDIFTTYHNSAKATSSDSSGYSEPGDINTDGDVESKFLYFERAASTELCSYFAPELSEGSYRSSESFNRECAACKLLMQRLNCEATKQFWGEIDNEGPNDHASCHVKFFEIFLEKLKDAFPREEGLQVASTIQLLKFLLKVNQKDFIAGIKLSDLKRITDLFGPIKKQDDRCELIRQLHLLIKRSLKTRDKDKRIRSSWFVGDMSREEAEKCLLEPYCKDKTYLVRISGLDGEDGDFALSVRHEDHCHHMKIKGNPKIALSESPYNAHLIFAGREFSSLPEVIDYVTCTQEIEIDTEDETGGCSSVTCLRVFTKSPLNGAMSGCEKTKSTQYKH